MSRVMSYIRPPSLSSVAVARLINNYFPFSSIDEKSIKELVSYDDRNYYFRGRYTASIPQYPSKQSLHVTSDNEFVLKMLNHRDSETMDTVEMLTAIKKFLYSKGLNVPFPVPSLQGSEILTMKESLLLQYINNEECVANDHHSYQIRVLTYIPGKMLHDVSHSPSLLFKLGRHLALVHTNLKVKFNVMHLCSAYYSNGYC